MDAGGRQDWLILELGGGLLALSIGVALQSLPTLLLGSGPWLTGTGWNWTRPRRRRKRAGHNELSSCLDRRAPEETRARHCAGRRHMESDEITGGRPS